MNNMLPIGSIVMIKESDVHLMIIGYDYKKDNNTYDYVAVIHMAGLGFQIANRKNDLLIFNRDSIKEVCFIAYMDKEIVNKLKYMEMKKNWKEGKE